jgi:membrane protein YqaA with SNARE-associated domain
MYKVLTVAALASFEIYAAIPAGFAFNLSPLTILAATIAGGLAGVFVSAFLGDRIRHLFTRNKKKSEEKPKTSLANRLWNRYGVIGLGLIGTLTVGAPASLAVGISMGASTKKLVSWCCLGVITRCTIFTTIGHFGVQLF